MGTTGHWDAIYRAKDDGDLSWTEESPATSLRLLTTWADPAAAVLDVGGGRSRLAAALRAEGFIEVCVLDLSAAALEAQPSPAVRTLVGDVLEVELPGPLGAWHDRAVFHFLTEEGDQARYAERAGVAVMSGGVVVLGCFGPEGPTSCSGLPVARHSAEDLARRFSTGFDLVMSELEMHHTPWGAAQQFCWVVLRRR